MNVIEFGKSQWKKPAVKGAVLVFFVFIVSIFIRTSGGDSLENNVEQAKTPVTVSTVANLSGEESISLIGSVRAFTEAKITTERAGRVTSVNTTLGSTVGAGQVIATLENASEQAAVLQAQGAYEAALANASQTTISVSEARTAVTSAQNSLISSIRGAYNSTNGVILNNVDTFFDGGDSYNPRLLISTNGRSQYFVAERKAFQDILSNWQVRANSVGVQSDLSAEAQYAIANTNRAVSFLDAFITIFSEYDGSVAYSEEEMRGYINTFTASRASLLQQISAIENAQSSLARAEDSVMRAETSATGGTASAADAQVKQALGSLRAAQANLAKTILRSPISGTVNSLSISVGDFVGSFEQVSIVANNNALEIVTYVGDQELEQLAVGDEVVIEGVYLGIITQIAPAVDQDTKKTEVRIATDNTDISNGDTVRITKETNPTTVDTLTVRVPLTAVKFEATNGFIMQVADGVLVEKPVTLGAVRGSTVVITEGLSADEEFVVDVRGLVAGTEVEVNS